MKKSVIGLCVASLALISAPAFADAYTKIEGAIMSLSSSTLNDRMSARVSEIQGSGYEPHYSYSKQSLKLRGAGGFSSQNDKYSAELGMFVGLPLNSEYTGTQGDEIVVDDSVSVMVYGFDVTTKVILFEGFHTIGGFHYSEIAFEDSGGSESESGAGFILGGGMSVGENANVEFKVYDSIGGNSNNNLTSFGLSYSF